VCDKSPQHSKVLEIINAPPRTQQAAERPLVFRTPENSERLLSGAA
jgi:hypothetical protein